MHSKSLKPLPTPIDVVLDDWFSSYELIHWWEQDETYFIVCVDSSETLHCLRVFTIGGRWDLSIDRQANLRDYVRRDYVRPDND